MPEMTWLAEHLSTSPLTEEVEGYLLGRGVTDTLIAELGCTTWRLLDSPRTEEDWARRYGPRGEKLVGRLITPLLSPRGQMIGFEARRIDCKVIDRHLLPEAKWNPVWIGLTPRVMQAIWAGADVYVVEGLFDLAALYWLEPKPEVVLSSVTAKLSDKHIEFLRRYCRGYVNMVYDNDETGQQGMFGWKDEQGKRKWGALDRLTHAGLKSRVVPYVGGKDPGELWSKFGVRGLRENFPALL